MGAPVLNLRNEDNISPEDYLSTKARALLPAWFIDRMTTDNWSFGLLTNTGNIICIDSIIDISQASNGTIWIDVELMNNYPHSISEEKAVIAPTSRKTASINTNHIVAAFELADT